jgi:hypothetical protein
MENRTTFDVQIRDRLVDMWTRFITRKEKHVPPKNVRARQSATRLTLRLCHLFEGSAEGPWAIAALLAAFLSFLMGRALGWL